MSFTVKRINREDVAPVTFADVKTDPRPIRGRALFPEIYANIFFCARKKSGKSCGIYHTIKECATKETKVIAFVSTLHRDPTWRAIQKLCEDMKVDFTGYTSIKDPESKQDILTAYVQSMEAEQESEKNGDEETSVGQRGRGIILSEDDDPRVQQIQKKDKKPKEAAPKYIFVFDDLSGELQTPSFTSFMKKNRHFKAKNIIASQNWNDIALQARKQLDYVLVYRGFAKSIDKLQEIYKNCDLTISFDQFYSMYRYATEQMYHFMWIDVVNSEFRKDFSHVIIPPKDEVDEPEEEPDERDS